jgi:hypothetical protein
LNVSMLLPPIHLPKKMQWWSYSTTHTSQVEQCLTRLYLTTWQVSQKLPCWLLDSWRWYAASPGSETPIVYKSHNKQKLSIRPIMRCQIGHTSRYCRTQINVVAIMQLQANMPTELQTMILWGPKNMVGLPSR